jgi:hypothetical protein
MKSKIGSWASAIFLLAVPTALIVQIIVGTGVETALHFAFAVGAALLAIAAFDFRLPRPISVPGAAVAAALASIFFLQGSAGIVQNASLNYIAFDVLGQSAERLLVDAVLLWLAAILVFDGARRTRLLGIVTLSLAISVEVYNYWLNYHGASLDGELPILKLALLCPFVWLIFESRNSSPLEAEG